MIKPTCKQQDITPNGRVRVLFFYLAFISLVMMFGMSRFVWHSSNLVWLSLTRSIPSLSSPAEYSPATRTNAEILDRMQPGPNTEGESYFHRPKDAKRNVLFVVLEGIPGVYVRQVQEWTGMKYQIEMPNLSRIAERSLVIPNFIAHNRQTIRGLYSMFSGDYCKLSLKTPKIYEHIRLPPGSRSPCLPEILADAGYTTAYIQAADLAYMSKDQFMPAAGFEQVFGKEYFRYQHVPFGWGPDDKAFFEQAAEFIENLNQKSNPWFLTLLTVGTHHPCAIPEELVKRFSSRKEAAVAYLDQALGDFFKRLEDMGALENTLVLFVSDESHGVTGQPYGRNWALAVAYTPESSGTVNPAVFGLIDIPYSILDYLDLTGLTHSFSKRSIFREQNTERSILFDSYFSDKKGVVKRCIDSNRVEVIQSANGELFSNSYERNIVDGERGRELSEKLRQYQKVANNSLYDSETKNRRYVLLENDEYIIGKRESRLLSSGQYLDIPGGTTVTVELKASVELNMDDNIQVNSESIRLILQMIKWYKKMPIPEISIPILKHGDSLQLSFSFYTKESLSRVWAYLQAISVSPLYSATLKIGRFSIEMKEGKLIDDFQINCFLIKERKASTRDLKPTYFYAGEGTGVSHHQRFSGSSVCPKGKVWANDHLTEHPVILRLWCNQNASIITFSTGKLDERYYRYMILLHLRIFKNGYHDSQEIQVSLNGRHIDYIWFDHSPIDKEVIVFFHREVLQEYDVNTISFKVNKPVTGSCDGKSADFELLNFHFQPLLPPVAHAGGAYNGLTYTNSLEALEENTGTFSFFEIDFEWTEDKRLVGLHDWGDIFERIFGFEAERPLNYNTFFGLETVLDITPLDLTSIKAFLSNNPAAKIITDVKSNNINALKKIAWFFPDYAERFIPQVYHPDEFVKAIEVGYKNIIWTLYRYQHIFNPGKILSHIRYWEDEYDLRPFAVTMPVPAIEKGIAKAVSEAGIPVYVHTINSCDDYVRLLLQGISSFYTDFPDVANCCTVKYPYNQALTPMGI